jgi:imidazolonepropionase-like amidohydrolase
MKRFWPTFLSVLLTGSSLCAQSVIIKNVNLIDVRTGKVLPGSSVVFTGETITETGPAARIKTPASAQIIDGTGKFLMPGMVDAHIHFFQSGSLYTRPDALDLRTKMPYEKEREMGFANTRDYLNRYLRLGVTTVIDVGGPFSNFLVRDSISRAAPSPNIFVTGPLFSIIDRKQLDLNDPPIVKISSTSQADSLFQKMMLHKPDFIKIWYIAGPDYPAEKSFPLIRHIAGRAHENNLKLAVHATELKTAQLAVEAGADILVHSVDDAEIPDELVKILKERKVSYTPTLVVMGNYYKTYSGRLDHHAQDLKWANPFAYGSLTDPEGFHLHELPQGIKYFRQIGIPGRALTIDSMMAVNVKKLMKAGVNVIVGTDAGNIGTMHASSYIQELEAMKKAGLSYTEILKAATLNAAVAFGKEKSIGSIEKGKLADLILLSKNPLESLDNLNGIDLVIKSGEVLNPESLVVESPEAVVQRQLNAYNARDIEAFLDTYAEDIELCNWNEPMMAKGKQQMRLIYSGLFERTPNLYCRIEKRIVQGNKVIDQEYVRFANDFISATAIYEVENGKIAKVTFVR